ncbi:MAG TPA: thioredoxin family protein [Elusimicrobiota bacterium]|nr:thioredoxin family protein [Elusimicrobiota bacterium]
MPLLQERERDIIRKKLEELSGPVKLLLFKENVFCETCGVAEQLLGELAALSDKLQTAVYNRLIDDQKAAEYGVERVPALVLEGPKGGRVRFFGIPGGYEFATLLEGLKDVAGGRADLAPHTRQKLSGLTTPVHIQVFVTSSCPFCPMAVRTAHKLAVEFPNITADMVQAEEFPELSQKYNVSGVPKVVINDKVEFVGAQPETSFADAILRAVA